MSVKHTTTHTYKHIQPIAALSALLQWVWGVLQPLGVDVAVPSAGCEPLHNTVQQPTMIFYGSSVGSIVMCCTTGGQSSYRGSQWDCRRHRPHTQHKRINVEYPATTMTKSPSELFSGSLLPQHRASWISAIVMNCTRYHKWTHQDMNVFGTLLCILKYNFEDRYFLCSPHAGPVCLIFNVAPQTVSFVWSPLPDSFPKQQRTMNKTLIAMSRIFLYKDWKTKWLLLYPLTTAFMGRMFNIYSYKIINQANLTHAPLRSDRGSCVKHVYSWCQDKRGLGTFLFEILQHPCHNTGSFPVFILPAEDNK